jgi:RNA-directed DNA polymerase
LWSIGSETNGSSAWIPANLYPHHVLDLRVDQWRKKQATGDVIIVRHSDDAVLGFQHREEAERRKKRGEGNPETFSFLGFTHFCGKSRPKGCFMVHRKTMGQRMAAKLKDTRQKLQMRRHAPVGETVKWLMAVVRGYFQYHAVPGNEEHGVRELSIRSSRRPGPGLRRRTPPPVRG